RIVDHINWTKFKNNPKWICGFSDITVLHSHIHQVCNVATIHGPMCAAYASENVEKNFMEAMKLLLNGIYTTIEQPYFPQNVAGRCQGILVGGNLCMLASLTGSISQL